MPVKVAFAKEQRPKGCKSCIERSTNDLEPERGAEHWKGTRQVDEEEQTTAKNTREVVHEQQTARKGLENLRTMRNLV